MSFFKNLFGKKSQEKPQASASPPITDPAKDPNLIRVHDAYGRELFITKQQWRDSVLLGHIEKVWHDPAALYSTIVQALRDGFGADMVRPAERLAEIDPDHERGAVLLAIVYREQKRVPEAEKVLSRHIELHGETGVVLTNLAKIETDQGKESQALQTLWRGLQLDPNQDNGVGWYEVIHREKEGPTGSVAALRRIAALPGSWRARLWLARNALERKQLEEACALYDEALAMAPRPVPTDMLQQISGDLGNHAHLPELLRFTEPHFQVDYHGLAVGNNLIKANLDLGRFESVRALLDQHYAQKRADWKETLAYWDTELAKAQVSVISPEQKMTFHLLNTEGPVWLPEQSPAAELFPGHPGEPVRIAFLGSSVSAVVQPAKPQHQMSDVAGRTARALPLWLSELVGFNSRTQVRSLVMWLSGNSPAFVLASAPWTDSDAAQHARSGTTPADYVVITHLKTSTGPWQIDLRLVRTIDAICLATATASYVQGSPAIAFHALGQDLLRLLAEHADVVRVRPPVAYHTPDGANFADYLLRLEQLLAVRCSAMPGVPKGFLTIVREIVDGDIQLCLRHPLNSVTRLVLIQTLHYLKRVHPEIVAEYREKIHLLQKENPLPGTAQAIAKRMLTEILADEG